MRGPAIVGTVCASLLALALAAPEAGAYVYWSTPEQGTISRATDEGGSVESVFIGGAGNPSALAVDAGHIYWANYAGHTIGRANIDGIGADAEFIKLPYAPTGIAVNESHLYWAGEGRIGRAAIGGGPPELEFIKEDVGSPCGLTVDSGHLYWSTGVVGPGYIERAPLNGSTVEFEYVKAGTVSGLCGVAVNTANVFWADDGFGGGTNIGRATLTTGQGVVNSFIGEALGPCGLTIYGSKLYWPNSGTSTIARANTDSTAPEYDWIQTGAPPRTICGIAVDALAPAPKGPEPGGGAGSGGGPGGNRPPDTTPPNTRIALGPGRGLANGTATFLYGADEVASFACRLDGRGAAPCGKQPAAVCKALNARCLAHRTYRGLQPGRHVFRVWATDVAGNKDPTPAKRRFRVPAAG
jgi:hypothetical protein